MILKTERLILTAVSVDDLALYQALLSDAEITRFLPNGQPYPQAQIQQHVHNRVAHWQHGFGSFVVSKRDDVQEKIGYVGVEYLDNTKQYVDIRYALLPVATGKGYALEAAKAVLDFTFTTTTIDHIYGVAMTDNHASIRLLQKLGMQPAPDVCLYEGDETLATFVMNSS